MNTALAEIELTAIRERDVEAKIGDFSMLLAPRDDHFMTVMDRRRLLGHISHLDGLIVQMHSVIHRSLEYKKHVQSHCEHDWTETLHGPDTVGEHCEICGVEREYDYGDEHG